MKGSTGQVPSRMNRLTNYDLTTSIFLNLGDIAFRYLDGVVSKQCQTKIDRKKLSEDIVICDINRSMLEVGKRRAQTLGIDQGKRLPFYVASFGTVKYLSLCQQIHFQCWL